MSKICFLIGSVDISGGTCVIFQHAKYLQDLGFDVDLAVQNTFTEETYSWHDQSNALSILPINLAIKKSYDLVVATWWKTALELYKFNAPRYAYFVQSIESRFYPKDEISLRSLVDATYHLPLYYVTEANWIKSYLRKNFKIKAGLVRNGIRKDIYSNLGLALSARNSKRPRVLIEGPFGVSFKNTALAIRLAKEAGAKDIWVLTSSYVSWLPGVSKVFSKIPMIHTPEIYRSCDILIKLSTVEGMFGPPLEIFHCGGTAIVFNVTGHDEYIIDRYNARVVSFEKLDQVVQVIKKLLNDAKSLNVLKKGAIETANQWPSWNESSGQFSKWISNCLKRPKINQAILKDITKKALAQYEKDEKQKLKINSKLIARQKLKSIKKYLPSFFVRWIKQFIVIIEVIFQKKEVL
jgi:glycosyltransferase involved in cell wall biosynthesis